MKLDGIISDFSMFSAILLISALFSLFYISYNRAKWSSVKSYVLRFAICSISYFLFLKNCPGLYLILKSNMNILFISFFSSFFSNCCSWKIYGGDSSSETTIFSRDLMTSAMKEMERRSSFWSIISSIIVLSGQSSSYFLERYPLASVGSWALLTLVLLRLILINLSFTFVFFLLNVTNFCYNACSRLLFIVFSNSCLSYSFWTFSQKKERTCSTLFSIFLVFWMIRSCASLARNYF